MRLYHSVLILSSVLLFSGQLSALADDSNKPVTLYGGVSHSEALKHVDHALNIHRNVIQPSTYKTETAISDTKTTSVPVVPEPPAIKGELSQKQTQAYLPMTGIAHAQNEATANLSGEVQKYSAEWFMIPPWLAGRWVKEGDLTVCYTDLRTGQKSYPNIWTDNKLECTWGHQKDAAGNFWHVNLLPCERDGKSDGKLVRFLTVMQKCEQTDNQALVTRTHYVVSESNFWTGQAVDMFQQESLNHYMMGADRNMVNMSTNRVFTYQGSPVRDGQLKTEFNRLAGFSPTTSLNGIDLKASLDDYLDSHGMSNLKLP